MLEIEMQIEICQFNAIRIPEPSYNQTLEVYVKPYQTRSDFMRLNNSTSNHIKTQSDFINTIHGLMWSDVDSWSLTGLMQFN